MKTRIKLIEGGKVPTKGSEKATCHDLYAREMERVYPWLYKVKLGVAIEPPEGYGVKIYPRSSVSKTGWMLANSVGVGDEDYRGEYMSYFIAVPYFLEASKQHPEQLCEYSPFPYKQGDRVAQFEIQKRNDFEIEVVGQLSDTDRGVGGFGSTGK